MRIIILSVFLSVTIFNIGVGQNCEYFNAIHEAEQHIMDGNFLRAVEKYKQTFKKNTKYFAKDVHNACMASIRAKNFDDLNSFAQILTQWDLSDAYIDFIEEKEIDSAYKNFLLDTLKGSSSSRINEEFCYFIEKVNLLDQTIRADCSKKYGNYYKHCGEEIKYLDSLILSKMIAHFHANGIPDTKEMCNFSVYDFPYRITLGHSLQWRRDKWVKYFEKNMDSLNIHPYVLMDWYSYILNNYSNVDSLKFGLNTFIINKDDLYILDVPKELLSVANKNLARFCMPDIISIQKRLKYQFYNDEFIFIYPFLIPKFSFSEDTFNSFFPPEYENYKVKAQEN